MTIANRGGEFHESILMQDRSVSIASCLDRMDASTIRRWLVQADASDMLRHLEIRPNRVRVAWRIRFLGEVLRGLQASVPQMGDSSFDGLTRSLVRDFDELVQCQEERLPDDPLSRSKRAMKRWAKEECGTDSPPFLLAWQDACRHIGSGLERRLWAHVYVLARCWGDEGCFASVENRYAEQAWLDLTHSPEPFLGTLAHAESVSSMVIIGSLAGWIPVSTRMAWLEGALREDGPAFVGTSSLREPGEVRFFRAGNTTKSISYTNRDPEEGWHPSTARLFARLDECPLLCDSDEVKTVLLEMYDDGAIL